PWATSHQSRNSATRSRRTLPRHTARPWRSLSRRARARPRSSWERVRSSSRLRAFSDRQRLASDEAAMKTVGNKTQKPLPAHPLVAWTFQPLGEPLAAQLAEAPSPLWGLLQVTPGDERPHPEPEAGPVCVPADGRVVRAVVHVPGDGVREREVVLHAGLSFRAPRPRHGVPEARARRAGALARRSAAPRCNPRRRHRW